MSDHQPPTGFDALGHAVLIAASQIVQSFGQALVTLAESDRAGRQ